MARRRRQTTRKQTGGNWVLALGGLLVVGGLVAWGALRVRAGREAEAAASSQDRTPPETGEPSPFGDMPGDSDDPFGGAAQGPVGDAVWTTAEELAATAEVLYQAAVAAKEAGDRKLMVEKGRDSIQRFQTALTDSEPVEADLIARVGERDSRTRFVVRARKLWFERVLWLHKSAMR